MMDYEFDNEIDAILRQTARGEPVSANRDSEFRAPNSDHLDADEFSAFTENALPEKTRQRYVLHLADCGDCRKRLSSLVALHAEQSSEIVPVEEKRFAPTPLPWYRKLFAVPNLAYAMGALVLVFSGIAAYTVLRSVDKSSTEVSRTYERQPTGKGMSSDGDDTLAITESISSNSAASNTSSSSNAAASTNSAMNTSTSGVSSAAPAAPSVMMNSNAAVLRQESDRRLPAESSAAAPNDPRSAVEMSAVTAAPPPMPAKRNDSLLDGAAKIPPPPAPDVAARESDGDLPVNGRNAQPAPKSVLRAESKRKSVDLSKEDREKSIETTTVGGKTFKRTDNVWYDAAYRGQNTVNVARGTNEYRKLDAGLRGIAETLGGTIVVLWKQKAYRIQ